jgi:hypothetical protein
VKLAIALAVGLASAVTAAPIRKKVTKKPLPVSAPVTAQPCEVLTACLESVEAAFEAADFETAQRRVRLAEPLAKTPTDQARVLVLQGALDAQSLGLTEAVKASVRAKFGEAMRLDPSLTSIAIPAFARTEALEALWTEARPVAPANPTIVKVEVPVAAMVAEVPPRRFPVLGVVLGATGVAALATGVTFGLIANGQFRSASEAGLMDNRRFELEKPVQTSATIANVGFATAGALALGATVSFLIWFFSP